MYILPTSISVHYVHVWCPQRPEEKRSDPQELELRMFVSHYVGAGNKIQIIWKSTQYS